MEDGTVRVRVRGELDMSTSPQLDQILRREVGAGKRVVVDLSQIAFIDSTGLNALIGALRASDTNGGALMVSSSLPAQVRRVFEITGLSNVLPIAAEATDRSAAK
jgi:anti-anti-sigma factor